MENVDVKVSVIIPVYNAEKYLRQCLDSVCAQTLREIEIICVDDGSSDSSRDILEEYASKDSRMCVIHQQNQYAGVARNNGMRHANGKYLMFWDADDFFEPDALEQMYNRSVEVDADVCLCKVNHYYTSTDTFAHADAILNMKYVPENDVFNVGLMGDNFFRFTTLAIWNKMVRKEFLFENNIEFQNSRNANDVYFTAVELYLAKRITVVDQYLVNYRKLDDSSVTFSASKSAFSIIDAWISAYDRIKKEVPNCQRSFANRALASLIGALHMTADYQTFCELVRRLKDGALERMGILPPQDGFYFSEKNSDWLEKLLALSPKEFHTYFTITTFRTELEQIQVNKDKVQKLKTKLQAKEEQVQNLKEKIASRNDRIQKQKDKIGKQEDRIEKQSDRIEKQSDRIQSQKERINDLETQIAVIKSSKSYCIGRMITWLPRKIFSLFGGDN